MNVKIGRCLLCDTPITSDGHGLVVCRQCGWCSERMDQGASVHRAAVILANRQLDAIATLEKRVTALEDAFLMRARA